MKVVLAEKPSVAREIAALLGAIEKKDGFLAGNGYAVTWAFGHLVSLAMPADYGFTGFSRAFLPILPNPYQLKVKTAKKGTKTIEDLGAARQLNIIRTLLRECDSIIVATDAGREGELIFRYIYEYLGCHKPFSRLWISSLTEKAILQGLSQLRPGNYFDGLYQSARARSQADWLIGINASQALSIAAGGETYSLGRVQTPTLALICKRYLDHINFTIRKYWKIQLDHRKEFIDFKSYSETKWEDKKQAENVLLSIQRAGNAIISDVKKKTISEQAPLLFDLTALQKEANTKMGLTAEDTLNLAQSLYEKKFITYPRTGSKYIPEDIWDEIPKLVRSLDEVQAFKAATSKLQWGRFNRRIVSDVKVTDHHGILITETIPSALPPKENLVYELIAYRLLEAISPSCKKEVTELISQSLHYNFSTRGVKILEPGWRAIKGNFSEDDTDSIQELPDISVGDTLKIMKATILERKTKPPVLYTEAGLLNAMETAGKDIDNDDERKALKDIGIGTPATRAAIIETLFTRNYILRQKKALVPTEKGLQVYHLTKERKISDVAMTAEWEIALQKIENNELTADSFHKEMEAYATSITNELLKTSINMEQLPELLCPKCKKQHLIIRDKIVKCPDEECNWVQFRNVCGVQISITDIESLVTKGKTSLIKGMKSKARKTFNTHIKLNDDFSTSFEFENRNAKK